MSFQEVVGSSEESPKKGYENHTRNNTTTCNDLLLYLINRMTKYSISAERNELQSNL